MKRARGGFITIALFAVAATLLTFSMVGSSRAALTYFSETYGAEVSMLDIGVTLTENGADISSRDFDEDSESFVETQGALVQHMLDEEPDGQLKLGKVYPEALAVRNTGRIPEYVRVSVYRYWEKDGQKTPATAALDSDLIELGFVTGSGWEIMEETEERTVLFYNGILPVGETTPAFTDTLKIDAEGVETTVHTTTAPGPNGSTIITNTYDYDGVQFVLKANVDAVQTNNAADAMRSAWGVSYLG